MESKTKGGSACYWRYIKSCVTLLVDYMAIVLAEKLVYETIGFFSIVTKTGILTSPSYQYVLIPAIFILFLENMGTYHKVRPILDTVRNIFYAVLYGFITCILLFYFMHIDIFGSRKLLVMLGIAVLPMLYIFRYVYYKYLKIHHIFYEPVILIGAGKTAEKVLRFFDGDLGYRYDVAGIIDDHPISDTLAKQYKLLGKMAESEYIVKNHAVQNVIITAPGLEREKLVEIISKVQPYVRNISFAPDFLRLQMVGAETSILFSEELTLFRLKNNLARRHNRIFKRIFDLALTISGGFVILPVLLLIALLVAKENHGRVIFAHKRVGKNGKLFPCYKFQTMIPNAQEKLEEYLKENPEAKKEWEESFKLTNDPRVTKLGAILRKTSLDELPQLWNVIRGDMSLVGPRPIVAKEIERYGEYFREYRMVLPGITGMWQVSGRSDTTYEERVEMDTWYVRNWSVWIDLMYLFKTVKAVLGGKGAY